MPVIELPGIQSQYASGANLGNYIAKSADAAANFACSLYKNYPGTIVPNPAEAGIRGLWDSLCKDRPPGLPPAPTQNSQGGQCEGVQYWWNYSTSYEPRIIGANGENAFSQQTGPLTQFKVTGRELYDIVNGVPIYNYFCQHLFAGQFLFQGSARGYDGDYPKLVTRRVDGLPDNCGDAPPNWNYSPSPPPGYESGTGSITYNDGTDLTVPLVFAPVEATANFNATFNVDVGGINFKFDLGGVKVDLGNGDNPITQPRDRTNDNSDDFDRINHRIDDITDKIDDISRRLPSGDGGGSAPPPPAATPPDSDPNLEPDPKQPDDPKDETGITKLKWVKIILTKLPDKVQFGDGAPNCYFAGWLEFKSGSACYGRQQINFQTSLFLAPAGADGYAYTLTNGAEGYAIVYKSKD